MTGQRKRRFSIFTEKAIPFLLLFLAGCSSLMYYPKREKIFDPRKVNLSQEEVYFTNVEGQRIHAWWFNSRLKETKGTWVFFHGNAENLTTHFLMLSWLPDAGYNYLIFDYPGYGESEGSPDPYHNVITGRAAMEWVHANKDPKPLIVYGQSMGGIVAMRSVIELKEQIPIKVVIADGTFSSFQRIARKKLSQHWLTWLFQPLAYLTLSDRWAPDVKKISPTPLIVIHGERDPVIEFEHGQRIYADAGEPKSLLTLPDGEHGNLFWVGDRGFRQTVLRQIDQIGVRSSQGNPGPRSRNPDLSPD